MYVCLCTFAKETLRLGDVRHELKLVFNYWGPRATADGQALALADGLGAGGETLLRS